MSISRAKGLKFCRRNMQAAAETDEIFLMRVQYVNLTGRKHTKERFQSTEAMSQNTNVPIQQINVARRITAETSICFNFFPPSLPPTLLKTRMFEF